MIHLNAGGTSTFEGSMGGSSTSTGSFGTIQTTTGTIPTLFGNTTINDISITSDSNHRTISKDGGAGAFNIKNTGANQDIRFFVLSSGVNSKALEIDGLTKALLPADNGMNLGASSTRWSNVHATNLTAHGGNISGSATSTGSFGSVHIADRLGIGTTNTFEPVVAYPDQDIIAVFGKAAFKGSSDVLFISHYDRRSGGGEYALNQNASGRTIVNSANGQELRFAINNNEKARVDTSGHFVPAADDTHNLGSSSKRWSDVFAVQTTTGGVFETGLKTEKIGDNPTGTIVSWRGDGLVPCDSNEDELVMGVIKEGKDEPIVMGAEPVLVTGKVDVGDYIVTSDKIGHGKSVKRGYLLKKDLFGKVIAQALEPSDDSDSSLIKCMIRKM